MSENMKFSDKQLLAIELAIKWIFNRDKQIFIIAGYAGTGKTSVLRYIIKELGIPLYKIAFATYTGKSAVILRKIGFNAYTIHKLIYRSFYDSKTKKISFTLRKSIPKNIELIVIDEIGMVPNKMIEDMMSFNVPIIGLGDPGQLPPIYGKNEYISNSDVFLDEIFRQSKDSSLLTLATNIRQKKDFYNMRYADDVKIIDKDKFSIDLLDKYDQVLCSTNKTKSYINKLYRKYKNIIDMYPVYGEKLICLMNNFREPLGIFSNIDIYLVNGFIGICNMPTEVIDDEVCLFSIYPDFIPSWKYKFNNIYSSTSKFISYYEKVKEDNNIDIIYYDGKIVNKFDFAYAITTHKSQGSEWDSVIVLDDCFYKDDENYHRWMYTSVTRAKKNILIVKDYII